ncbi:METTL5 family protein [Methanocaldococcus indicus]|uniref:METTL5 family protein n=1 Tax=Methanocaldococcus indicus TaxID=213231 RepID=UPI003C6D9A3D
MEEHNIKMKHLKMIIDKIPKHPNPKAFLEQYTIDGELASNILYFARNDFKDNVVIDLGCGTGRLGIGAKILGAKRVLGFDIDKECVDLAKKVVRELDLDNIEFYCKDIREIDREYINNLLGEDKNLKKVVIQNPPFGAQKRNADRIFLDKALEIGDVIYTIHNYPTKDFVKRYIEEKGGNVTHIAEAKFRIPAIYEFHKKKVLDIPVVIFRVEKKFL